MAIPQTLTNILGISPRVHVFYEFFRHKLTLKIQPERVIPIVAYHQKNYFPERRPSFLPAAKAKKWSPRKALLHTYARNLDANVWITDKYRISNNKSQLRAGNSRVSRIFQLKYGCWQVFFQLRCQRKIELSFLITLQDAVQKSSECRTAIFQRFQNQERKWQKEFLPSVERNCTLSNKQLQMTTLVVSLLTKRLEPEYLHGL